MSQETSPKRAARLKALGLWKDFQRRRKELEAGGMPKAQAYEAAAAEFRPEVLGSVEDLADADAEHEGTVNGREPEGEGVAVAGRSTSAREGDDSAEAEAAQRGGAPGTVIAGRAPTVEDCQWVYQAMGAAKGEAGPAPSAGAAGLLEQARDNRQVYEWVLDRLTPKTFPTSEADEEALELTGLRELLLEEFGEVVETVTGKRKAPDKGR